MDLNTDYWVERSLKLSFGLATIVVDRRNRRIVSIRYGVLEPRHDGAWPELTAADVIAMAREVFSVVDERLEELDVAVQCATADAIKGKQLADRALSTAAEAEGAAKFAERKLSEAERAAAEKAEKLRDDRVRGGMSMQMERWENAAPIRAVARRVAELFWEKGGGKRWLYGSADEILNESRKLVFLEGKCPRENLKSLVNKNMIKRAMKGVRTGDLWGLPDETFGDG